MIETKFVRYIEALVTDMRRDATISAHKDSKGDKETTHKGCMSDKETCWMTCSVGGFRRKLGAIGVAARKPSHGRLGADVSSRKMGL